MTINPPRDQDGRELGKLPLSRTLRDDLRSGGYEGKTYVARNDQYNILVFKESEKNYGSRPITREMNLAEGHFQIKNLYPFYQINQDFQSVVGVYIEFKRDKDSLELMVDLSDILNAQHEKTYPLFGVPDPTSGEEPCGD